MGAIQASFEGSEGRLGKYFACRFSRKEGSEGSRSGTDGPVGKCIEGWMSSGRRSLCVEDAGWRPIGAVGSLSSSSKRTDLAGSIRLPADLGAGTFSDASWAVSSCDVPAASVVLSSFLIGASGGSIPVSPLPSSRFDLLSSISSKAGLSPAISSFRSSSISSTDMAANLCLFSSSICRRSWSLLEAFCVSEEGLVGVGRKAKALGVSATTGFADPDLCCLKVDIFVRFLCSGNPVGVLFIFGAEGGAPISRSMISPTKGDEIEGSALEGMLEPEFGCSSSSERSISNR